MYRNMFSVSGITQPPKIYLTERSGGYYFNEMFAMCRYLVKSPAIYITPTNGADFGNMFINCQSLIKVEVHCESWVNQSTWLSGVAATGDFYNLGGATIPTGTDGIPSGWTEHTQLP